MVATASTEHPIGCKQQPTQAIAFGWKPGFRQEATSVKQQLT